MTGPARAAVPTGSPIPWRSSRRCDGSWTARSSGTSPRSRAFLAYVVTETLAGRGHRLKERTVARYALGRTKDFDAATDAAARVQANRLRTSIQRYYAGTGAADPLVIDLPRGSYVPRFTYRETDVQSTPSGSLEPGLVVVQFADMPSPKAPASRWGWLSPSP